MRAILEFNLPEEQEAYKEASKGGLAHSAIQDFYTNSLRRRLKYEELSSRDFQLVEEIKKEFAEIMNSYEIEF